MTWACERFQDYLIGTQFRVETDHKPLVPLLSSKALNAVPVSVQQFRLRLMRFRYSISHAPGRELNTADTLSRAPVSEVDGRDDDFHKEVNAFVNFSGVTTIGAGRAVAPPLFDGSKLKINVIEWPTTASNVQ